MNNGEKYRVPVQAPYIGHRKPYIGITGFMTREEVEKALGCMPFPSRRLLMIGVLANETTMKSYNHEGNGHHPNVENIKNIFVSHPSALNMVHYHTKDTDTLFEQLMQLSEMSGQNLHGFQFNMVWPPKIELKKYYLQYPNHLMVLVIDDRALNAVGNSPELLISKIKEYEGLIDYILLDRSLGYGIPMDTDFMRKYISVLRSTGLGIVIAGGLSSKTLYKIGSLVRDFKGLSIDAENNIRNTDDSLNPDAACDYIYGALRIFGDE